ncbi:peptidoglycan editing factor PgeF [Salisediminibacterium halotolerans]|uniref:peptidoglycan editing factor PgeF n=1 Tax=Salisediminibacterium halotolerans TaxID=517425 RepID=UPI000F1A0DCF|nr:peptidoglycan editing factor PgeF [Salisediminibacterium halotolerans]RLJ72361.1 hypothetical protein BCL39_2261 [Actinophytocola xinjiangensis]RPE85575.1 hypothetical protein EDD67_2396 [Salisediminibacterium halotolerans]TWG33530.1 hypothetical protein BCL52_2256 [Salisediminibacterium halotolerans]GEL08837.1 laccase domain protein [Salisediminibacterium halotolerans]
MSEPLKLNTDQQLKINVCDHVSAGFSTKLNGFSRPPYDANNLGMHVDDTPEDVVANRRKFASNIGIPLSDWVWAEQTHSDQIVKVHSAMKGMGGEDLATRVRATDGLYTKETGVVLSLLFADCVPVYFSAPSSGIVGVAHAGWQGTVKNISGKMVQLWTEYEQIPFEDIHVLIGPAISSCCYEVDENVIRHVDEVMTELDISASVYEKQPNERFILDLKSLNFHLLVKHGISPEHIDTSAYCTKCRSDLFFSHRRDGSETGRMAAWIYQE